MVAVSTGGQVVNMTYLMVVGLLQAQTVGLSTKLSPYNGSAISFSRQSFIVEETACNGLY